MLEISREYLEGGRSKCRWGGEGEQSWERGKEGDKVESNFFLWLVCAGGSRSNFCVGYMQEKEELQERLEVSERMLQEKHSTSEFLSMEELKLQQQLVFFPFSPLPHFAAFLLILHFSFCSLFLLFIFLYMIWYSAGSRVTKKKSYSDRRKLMKSK